MQKEKLDAKLGVLLPSYCHNIKVQRCVCVCECMYVFGDNTTPRFIDTLCCCNNKKKKIFVYNVAFITCKRLNNFKCNTHADDAVLHEKIATVVMYLFCINVCVSFRIMHLNATSMCALVFHRHELVCDFKGKINSNKRIAVKRLMNTKSDNFFFEMSSGDKCQCI